MPLGQNELAISFSNRTRQYESRYDEYSAEQAGNSDYRRDFASTQGTVIVNWRALVVQLSNPKQAVPYNMRSTRGWTHRFTIHLEAVKTPREGNLRGGGYQ